MLFAWSCKDVSKEVVMEEAAHKVAEKFDYSVEQFAEIYLFDNASDE